MRLFLVGHCAVLGRSADADAVLVGLLLAGFAFSFLLLFASGRFRLRLPRVFRTRIAPGDSILPELLPLGLGSALVGTGLGGLTMSVGFHLAGWVLWAFALGSGIVLASIFVHTLRKLYDGSAHQLVGSALVGKVVRISIPIPMGGVGAVAYVAEGKRHTMPARCQDPLGMSLGDPAFVVSIEGGVAIVEAF